jgi:hypothetical protein
MKACIIRVHLLGKEERNAMETLKQRILRYIQAPGCTAHKNEIEINVIIMYMNQMSDLTVSVLEGTASHQVHFYRNSFSICIIPVPRKEKSFLQLLNRAFTTDTSIIQMFHRRFRFLFSFLNNFWTDICRCIPLILHFITIFSVFKYIIIIIRSSSTR